MVNGFQSLLQKPGVGGSISDSELEELYLKADGTRDSTGIQDFTRGTSQTKSSITLASGNNSIDLSTRGGWIILTGNAGGSTVQNITTESDGQVVYLKFLDANTTLEHGAGIIELKNDVDYVSSAGEVVALISDGTIWSEAFRAEKNELSVDRQHYTWASKLNTDLGVEVGVHRVIIQIPSGMSGTITALRAMIDTAPAGSSLLMDVNKNGTTIGVTGGFSIAAAANDSGKKTAFTVTTIADGDYLTFDIDAPIPATPGQNLTVDIEIELSAT